MLKRLMKIHDSEKGITGLETAIILIAFVVVAAVFAYTVLSAGLFATQKSSEAVYSGLKEVQGTLELKGSVIAYSGLVAADTAASVTKVEFTVTSNGKERIDLTPPYTVPAGVLTAGTSTNVMQIAYSDDSKTLPDCAWTTKYVGKNNGDEMLDPGEEVIVTVWLHDFDGTDWTDGAAVTFLNTARVDTYHKFNIEAKPASGAVLTIQRTTPAIIDTVIDLH
jgi:archaeal flagellin FlaB